MPQGGRVLAKGLMLGGFCRMKLSPRHGLGQGQGMGGRGNGGAVGAEDSPGHTLGEWRLGLKPRVWISRFCLLLTSQHLWWLPEFSESISLA